MADSLLPWSVLSASEEETSSLLLKGEVVAHQVIPAGTNYTFSALMSADGMGRFLAIYKPRNGENPLWDFPDGTLYLREHAAYLASRFIGWPRIPTTVIREGPYGMGMVQIYVPTRNRWDFADLQQHHREELMEIALFDLVANNADRKAGHCLLGADGHVWAIDHGLTFNVAPKLRTVLWDYCDEPIPPRLLSNLESLHSDSSRREGLHSLLQPNLTLAEIEACFHRVEQLLRARRFPRLDPRRNVPWPLV